MNGLRHDTSRAPNSALDIWQFSADVSNRLLLWNGVNFALGLLMSRIGGFWRGFGSQNIGWSIINIGIAIFGKRAGTKRFERLVDPYELNTQRKDIRNLRLLLAVNGVLDLFYMLAGFRLARGARRPVRRGIGLGILVQGFMLFAFDWRMVRRSLYIRPRVTDVAPTILKADRDIT